MASLILSAAGQAIGGALGTFDVLGFTLSGAQLGGAIGAFVGAEVDAALAPGTRVHGPRLSDVSIQSSTEGAPVPRVWGRVRVAGQLIWATQYKETASTSSTGGKGIGGPKVTETDYAYSISFAVGLAAGAVTRIGRVWADGALIDLTQFTTRFYAGSETQAADTLIEEVEGAGNTPAYRGLCYIVFEDMALAQFGNRIPQLQFELIRAISDADPSALENVLTGVAIIPGAGEFVYATDVVTAADNGTTVAQNAHNASGVADWTASLDELQALAPAMARASLVVGWFADSVLCGSTLIKPGVELAKKKTYPQTWSVNGVARADAHLVSTVGGKPAYGGTPSDASVVSAIADLNARGLAVTFCPFLFMDCTGYPWRGRISCDPAVDQTAAAAAQVAAFFGAAAAGDFAVDGTNVTWTGSPTVWGWRRMVLHYAHLCAATSGAACMNTVRFSNGAGGGPAFSLAHSRATTIGALGVLSAGDQLGVINFCGDDGASYNTVGAQIKALAVAGGAISTGVIPGQIVCSIMNAAGTMIDVCKIDNNAGVTATQLSAPKLTSNAASALDLATSGGTQFEIAHTASAVNFLQAAGSASGAGTATLAAAGTDSNVDIVLTPKGTGAVRLPTVANGSVATALSSVGPTGAHTTVQEWFAVKNAAGVVRYIPAF